jgi:DNA primase
MNVLDLATKKIKLRKVSSTRGGEYQGACPGCGGTDRFHVWPLQNEGKGSYWCRSCEKAGDNIQFLRDFEGLSFKDACAYLNVTLPERPEHYTPSTAPSQKPEFTPENHAAPAELWQEKAEKLVSWAQENLKKNTEALAWLADRGINGETAENFRLGWNPGEDGKDIYRHRKSWGLPEILKEDGKPRALWIPQGLVIPYVVDRIVHRVRIRRPEGEPRYYVIPGSSTATMIIEHARRAFVIVESELDAITVAAHNTLAGAVALGSVSAKPDAETCAILQGALQILVALDYDEAGLKAMKWW